MYEVMIILPASDNYNHKKKSYTYKIFKSDDLHKFSWLPITDVR